LSDLCVLHYIDTDYILSELITNKVDEP
jgi:hypothetical protein